MFSNLGSINDQAPIFLCSSWAQIYSEIKIKMDTLGFTAILYKVNNFVNFFNRKEVTPKGVWGRENCLFFFRTKQGLTFHVPSRKSHEMLSNFVWKKNNKINFRMSSATNLCSVLRVNLQRNFIYTLTLNMLCNNFSRWWFFLNIFFLSSLREDEQNKSTYIFILLMSVT